jgi:hypothetical protein
MAGSDLVLVSPSYTRSVSKPGVGVARVDARFFLERKLRIRYITSPRGVAVANANLLTRQRPIRRALFMAIALSSSLPAPSSFLSPSSLSLSSCLLQGSREKEILVENDLASLPL